MTERTPVLIIGGSRAGGMLDLVRPRNHDDIDLQVASPMMEPAELLAQLLRGAIAVRDEPFRRFPVERYHIHEFVFGDAPGLSVFVAAPIKMSAASAFQELCAGYRKATERERSIEHAGSGE